MRVKNVDLSGKSIVITGASNGIGLATAQWLADMNAQILMVCRNSQKAEEAKATLSGSGHRVYLADLSRPAEVAAATAQISSDFRQLDVLINNAGFMGYPERTLTADGLEVTFATNHLAYFGMVDGLLQVLKNAASARIINVASVVHTTGKVELDNLQLERDYHSFRAYCRSKAMNVHFTRELAARLEGTAVTANSLHPGNISSGVARTYDTWFRILYWVGTPFLGSPRRGARTSVYLASSPEVEGVSGAYYDKLKRAKSAPVDPELQQGLWQKSEEIWRQHSAG